MIGLGAKYLTAAGFGRYRITAASLGNLDLLDSLGWLRRATKQAIVGAFGQTDGKAVIKATNAYLNDIAASDRDKAQQIADWLNAYAVEDANIVYSLVPTLGVIRWLTSSGGALINTGHYPQADRLYLKTKLQIHGPVKSGTQFVAYGFYNGNRVPVSFYCPGGVANTMTVYHEVAGVLGTSASSFSFAKNETVEVEVTVANNSRTVTQNGVNKTQTFSGSLGNNMPIILFGSRSNSGYYMEVASSFSDTILDDLYLVPFIRNNVNGMLDLIGGTFYANAGSGSFTISETPSTP